MNSPAPDFATLFDGDWMSGKTSLEAFLHRVTDSCVEWFGAGSVSLFLRSDPVNEYFLAAQSGPDSHIPVDTTLIPGRGIAGEAIWLGKPMLVSDSAQLKSRGRRGSGSSMIVPLTTHESGCVGVLNVYRNGAQSGLSDADLRAATGIARYVALAVNNARLFARMNQAVGEARALSAKLDAIIANLGVGVLVLTAYNEVTGWNPEARALFGPEIEYGSILEVLAAKQPKGLEMALHAIYEEAKRGNRTSRRAVDAKTDRAWSVVASPLPGGGATIAIQNITEHERALRELSRIMRLAEIGQMTAAVAHEIRNPLTGIRSAAQMVQSCGDEAAEFGRMIEEEALKLNSLCDQFLDFARPLQLSSRSIDVEALIRGVAESHRHQFEDQAVELTIEIEDSLPSIEGDPLRLEQVVRNLLLNSLQACKAGDRVTICLTARSFAIKDSGHGLTDEQKEHLFTPFFTTKSNGTGLGLPTVRKIVDAHGWSIEVESQSGVGSTFRVAFKEDKAA